MAKGVNLEDKVNAGSHRSPIKNDPSCSSSTQQY